MDHQTWIKTTEGNFIAVDKVSHIVAKSNGTVTIYVISGNWAGTLPSAGAFFDAMMRGISQEEVGG